MTPTPRHRRAVAVVALSVVLMTTGCTFPEAGTNTVEFSGTIDGSDGQFRMDGSVIVEGTNDADVTNVTVVLYDDDRSVIERVPVGSLSSDSDGPHPTERPINITSDRRPAYVLIESPDIWDSGVESEAFRWSGEYYTEYWVGDEDERFRSG